MGGRGSSAKKSVKVKGSGGGSKENEIRYKELDKDLIKRSNEQSFVYDAGDSINREYKKNIEDIKQLDLSKAEKREAIEKQYELNTTVLKAQSKYVSVYVSGPARKVKANDPKNLDLVSAKRAEVKEHMNSLKAKAYKNTKAKESKGLFDAMSNAIKNKQLTMTYGGKTYQRKSLRGKTFTRIN